MTRCVEKQLCKTSYMNPNKKIKHKDWNRKKFPPEWLAADFECGNIPVDHPRRKFLYKNEPRGVGYIIDKSP